MDSTTVNETIVLIARETGWTLEYIRGLKLSEVEALVKEIRYQRAVEEYRMLRGPALAIATWLNVMTDNKNNKVEDLIGHEPKR